MLLAAALGAAPAWAALAANSIDVPTRIGRGQTVPLTVQVTRVSGAGPETVTVDTPAELSVVTPLPTGCTLAGVAGAPQTVTCTNINPVGVGATASFGFQVRGRALGGGNVTASTAGPPASSASDSFSVVSGGDLTVAKSIAPSATLLNGQTATFTLTPAILSGDPLPAGATVTVNDQLPGSAAEFELTGVSAPGYTCNTRSSAQASRLLSCTAVGPLASLGPITVQGRPTLAGSGGLVNNASISPDGTTYIDINPANDTTALPFTIEPGTDVRPSGTFPTPTVVGTVHTLQARYVNDGPQTVTGGTLRVAIPAGFVLGTLPTGCTNTGAGTVNGITGTVLSCVAGTVAAGGQQVFAIPLTTPSSAGSGNFGLEVVTGTGGALPGNITDLDTGNNLALVPFNVIDPYADLAITKSKTPGPLPPGSLLTSTISVTNTGIAVASYTAGTGPQPLRVVETMSNDELFVSAAPGWTCVDDGPDSAGAGLRRVRCVRDAAGTLAVGASVPLVLTTRISPALTSPRTLTNTACTGAAALSQLGLPDTAGPQPPDGNQNSGADCGDASTVGTTVISGQAQAGVVKESSIDGINWVDSPATPPVLPGGQRSHFWRIRITTPTVLANPVQQPIPTLVLTDVLPAVMNVASPAVGVPSYRTPAATVNVTVGPGGSAGGGCSPTAQGVPTLSCSFTDVTPGTTITLVVRVDRPFEAGDFTNTATLSSPNAILTAAPGSSLDDSAAIRLEGRTDPAITSKTITPPEGPNEPRVGQVVSYTIVARNLGPNPIQGRVTVSDTLPTSRFRILGATPVGSGSAPPMTCTVSVGAGTVVCTTPLGSQLQRFDFYTVTISARVLKTPGMPATGVVETFTNTAAVALDPALNCEFRQRPPGDLSGACNDAEAISNNQGQVTTQFKVPLVDLVQKKLRVLPSGQSAFGFGDTLRYRFRAQASGLSRAEGVTVTDRLNVPPGYTVSLVAVAAVNSVAAEAGFSIDTTKSISTVACTQAGPNADVACTLASGADNFLDPATEVNFDLTFTLTGPSAVITVGNTARICSDESLLGYESSGSCVFSPPATAGNNIAAVNDVVFPKTDLAITKSRLTASPVAVNQPVQWALALQNRGADATTQVRVSDVLPAGFEFVPGSASTTVGGFAGLTVSALACTATPAVVTSATTRQTVSCIIDGTFPGNTAVTNTVTLQLSARAKEGVFTGPYASDLANDATISPGLDAGGQPLSIDSNAGNNTSSATVRVQNTSLTGLVFQDRQRTGADAGTPQAPGLEPRIAGVTLNLSGTDAFGNTITRTATTGSDGRYTFANLPPSGPGGYAVTQTQPAGFDNGPAAPPIPVTGGTYDRGGTAGNSSYAGVVLVAGATAGDYNFPEVRRPSLSGFVYIDVDANGTRNPGTDLPIAGATVLLRDATTLALINTTTTDATGAWSFSNLDPLRPVLVEQPLPGTPVGLANGPVNPGLIGGAPCGSGCTPQPNTPAAGTDRIAAINLGAGTDGTQFNFGEVQQTSISGLVFIDRDRDNTLGAGDTGRIPGVTMTLVQGADCSSGTVLQTTTTDATGAWRFDNVRAFLNYRVCQTQPVAYGNGSAGGVAGANSVVVSNLPAVGVSGIPFGELVGSLAGSVYQDTGAGTAANFDNGVRDAGEPGIASVPVTLSGIDILGNPVSLSTVTDADGRYRFDDLLAAGPGGYSVVEGAIPPAAGSFIDGRDTAGNASGSVGADRVDAVALAAGQEASGYLFGELPNASIGGTVYIDRDRDDQIDPVPTDGRLPGVTIRLVRGADCSSGTTLQTTTTDADGNYRFDNVAGGGTYLVCQTQPTGYGNGTQNPGTGGSVAGANALLISNLPAGGSTGNHFGERVASLAGSVYADFTAGNPVLTDNGQRDPTESGIAGVTVTLSGTDVLGNAVTRNAVTDASGNWRFDDLLAAGPGGYSVVEGPIPASAGSFNDGRERVGSAGGTSTINDRIDGIALAAGAVGIDYLFGELPVAQISGTVYIDRDRDGALDALPTDGRLGGVTLRLVAGTDCSAAALATTTSDGSGNYSFTGLSAGLTYSVCQTQPAGYADGSTNPGAGAASGAPNVITVGSLPAAGSAGNHFGERAGTLAGSVYADFTPGNPTLSDNGQRDAGETGIAGVTVTLSGTDVLGNPVSRSTVTDASGNWRFDDLLAAGPGGYSVVEDPIPPSAGVFNDGRERVGSAGGSSSTNDRFDGIVLAAGAEGTGYLFGELPIAPITGTVYLDRDRDGTLDPEPTDGRLGGVTLRLVAGTDCSATAVATTTTDASGNYSFSGVSVGLRYSICQVQPVGYADGAVNPGAGAGSTTANVITIDSLPAAGSAGNHFGERAASLAGSVYADFTAGNPGLTDNGQRDAGEPGIAGVTITLTGTDAAGSPVNLSTVTDASGNWRFDDLLAAGPGGYRVVEGALPAAAGAFNDGRERVGNAGGSSTVNDRFDAITLGAGVDGSGYLFGELPSTTISGTVYLDRDGDGVIDVEPTDGRLPGVVLNLVAGNDCSAAPLASATTDASGNYSFAGVSAGLRYSICQVQPVGYAEGSTNPGAGGSAPAPNRITIDSLPVGGSAGNHFGERAAVLSGAVYLDDNNDGARASGEPGIGGVTITLTGTDAAGNVVNRNTTTDATGAWRFDDLLAAGPGGYTVTEQAAQPVVGGVPTLDGRSTAGSTGGSGSPVGSTPSRISAIPLPAGGTSSNHLFGEIRPVGISGTVFIDLDNNGLQNLPADLGLGGLPLVITGIDDTGAAVTRNIITGPDGRYSVPDLRPGTYTVTQPTQPSGTSNGQTLPGTAGGTATTPTTLPSAISAIALTVPGTVAANNNFAEIPNNSVIEGRVWLDADNDGLIDSGEGGIGGVTIELSGTDTAGRPVSRSTLTDSDGRWRFEGLAPGNYTVTEPTQPPGTINGRTLSGTAGGTASAVGSTPSRISGVVLGVGASSSDNLFGEVPSGSISGRVWADNDNDGVVDPGEGGLAGVTLVLTGTDDQGNPVSVSVVTDADGRYRFDGLRPGTYVVTQPTQPPGTVGGLTRAGSAGGSATAPGVGPSVISAITLLPGVASVENNFGELAESPDLRVAKSLGLGLERFTVGFPGRYTIAVRNVGEVATRGAYTVRDRLPVGLALTATPTGAGWVCSGNAGETQFSCTRSDALPPGATAVGTIEVVVSVSVAAAEAGSVDNAVLVEGGGEIEARGPSAAQQAAFAGNPGALPVCGTVANDDACRRPTPVQRPAAVSGTVWHDVGSASRLLDGGDRRLEGWQIEVVDTGSGQVVGRATTGVDGSYRVAQLLPGVPLAVRFREPGSGVVFGYPVNGETSPGSSGASCSASPAPGAASSCVGGGADPTLTVVLAPGQELPQQSLPVDPSGVIYDSGLRQAVPGAVVTLRPDGACGGWNPATHVLGAGLGGFTVSGERISMTVGADGFYQFLFTPSAPARCNFALDVVPPAGYTFQSTAIPPTAGPLLPPGAPGSVFEVQPNSGPPTGPVGPATTYFLSLSSGSAGANVIHNHIPLDPELPSALTLAKTGDRAVAEIGDTVRYAITVRVASGALPRQTTVVDRLPAGFTYIRGTASANGLPIADPVGGLGPRLAFNLGPMPVGREIVLRYRVRVGVGAAEGDGLNRARAHACGVPTGCVDAGFTPLAGSVATNEGQHRVRVSGGVFGTDACFAGKVFVDCNNNHVQDPEELGIPGVRLVMQDGTQFVSDSEGKYAMCGLPPKSAVLKVDPLTMPRGSRLTTTSNRNLGDAGSLWLDLKNGELHRADFAEGSCSNTVLEQVKARRAQGEVRAPETERRDRPALRFDSKAHQLDTQRSPQQGTDGANQQAPKPRTPAAPAGPVRDETHTPTPALPMNRPPPRGRDSGTPPSAASAASAPASTPASGAPR